MTKAPTISDLMKIVETISETETIESPETIYQSMSMLEKYRLHERLPFVAGGPARSKQAIAYIEAHPEEFNR